MNDMERLAEMRTRYHEVRAMVCEDASKFARDMCDRFEMFDDYPNGDDVAYTNMRDGITDVVMAELLR